MTLRISYYHEHGGALSVLPIIIAVNLKTRGAQKVLGVFKYYNKIEL